MSGPRDGQEIEQGQMRQTDRQTMVRSEPGAPYIYTRNHRSQKIVKNRTSSGKVCGPFVVLGALF